MNGYLSTIRIILLKSLQKELSGRNEYLMMKYGSTLKATTMDKKEAALNELSEKIIEGLEKTYEKLVEYKRYKKSPMVVSQNGKIIEIPPEELPPTIKYKRSPKE